MPYNWKIAITPFLLRSQSKGQISPTEEERGRGGVEGGRTKKNEFWRTVRLVGSGDRFQKLRGEKKMVEKRKNFLMRLRLQVAISGGRGLPPPTVYLFA